MANVCITPEIDAIIVNGNFNLAKDSEGNLSWVSMTCNLCCKESLHKNCNCSEDLKDAAFAQTNFIDITKNEVVIALDIDEKKGKSKGTEKV